MKACENNILDPSWWQKLAHPQDINILAWNSKALFLCCFCVQQSCKAQLPYLSGFQLGKTPIPEGICSCHSCHWACSYAYVLNFFICFISAKIEAPSVQSIITTCRLCCIYLSRRKAHILSNLKLSSWSQKGWCSTYMLHMPRPNTAQVLQWFQRASLPLLHGENRAAMPRLFESDSIPLRQPRNEGKQKNPLSKTRKTLWETCQP